MDRPKHYRKQGRFWDAERAWAKKFLEDSMQSCGNSRTKCAWYLDLNRNTLCGMLKRHGLIGGEE